MLNKIVRIFGGDPNKRQIEKYTELVDLINSLEPSLSCSAMKLCASRPPSFA